MNAQTTKLCMSRDSLLGSPRDSHLSHAYLFVVRQIGVCDSNFRERALEEEELLRFGSNDTNDTNPVGLFMVNALQSVTDRLERMNTSNGNPRNNCDQRRSSIRCHFCRQFGHVRKFCPKLKGKGKTANKGNCYNCNRPGHFKRDCPWEPANERPGNQYGTAGWGGGSSQRYPRR